MNCETLARELAEKFHTGQFDKAGEPYITHPERVVRYLKQRWPDYTDVEVQAAWLHDVLEDTDATPVALLVAGVFPEVIELVQLLSRPKEKTYREWIRDLANSGNVSAIRVKLADNADNSDPARTAALGLASDMVRKRYLPAKEVLEVGLAALEATHDHP